MAKAQPLKMKYKDIKSFEFSQLAAKLANSPTINVRANHIRHIIKELNAAGDRISEEYKTDLIDVYAKKDEEGKIVRPEGDPNGFVPDDTKMEEFMKAQDAFGDREAEINWRPLTPDTLSDIKLTAKELDLLGELFTDDNGPGVPGATGLQLQR